MPASSAKPSIADTFTRLLRLNVAGGAPLVSRDRLMKESEAQLTRAAQGGNARDREVASYLLANPADYQRWETEHGRLMASVAGASRPGLQVRALLSTTFSLIHRKALFEYLRGQALRGLARRSLMQHFHGTNSYSQSVVSEHGNYRRSVASLICAEQIGVTLLAHQAFGEPLRRYEHLYAEYFRSYCDSFLAPVADGDTDSVRTLLPYLKRNVLEVRSRLLAMPGATERGVPVKPSVKPAVKSSAKAQAKPPAKR